MIRKFTTFFLFAFLVSATMYGQVVKITLEPFGVSPRDVAKSTTDIYTSTSTGLHNVGVGSMVYIKASITGKKFGSVVWSNTRFPAGTKSAVSKTADVKNDSTQVFSFRADKAGVYELTLTDGSYSSSIVINAAKYLGYTNTVVNGTDTKLNCNTCHSSYVAKWQGTGHATFFNRAMTATPGISGPADHYSKNCISCHTTGYDADTTAVNDGFDDLGFVYPSNINPKTLDTLLVKYPNAMLRANIQCESCHGPASGHLGNTQDSRMEASFSTDVCAYCHDSGTHHIFPEEWDASGHAVTVDESGPGRESCVRCHTGKGFAQYAEGVSTTDPYFDPSYTAITCAACHDPHDATNIHQLRKVEAELLAPNNTKLKVDESVAGTGALCFNCHQSRTEANAALNGTINLRFGPHHGPQGDMLMSNNMLELGGVKLAKSNHLGATGDACVKCHMFSGNSVVNNTVTQMGGHSFNMFNYKKDADGNFLLDENGARIIDQDNMAACAQCHGNTFGTTFADVKFFLNGEGDLDDNGVTEGLQTEVKGMIDKIYAKIQANEGTLTPSSKWNKTDLSAFWNAKTAEEDRSLGIHNPKYIVTGLLGAMKSLGIVTAVEEEQVVPAEYALFQNYPNPFNPTTNIRFALPKSSNVKVTIYDAIGKEVAVVMNNELNAGTHTISWNASGLASGIYLCRIEANDFVKVNKMLLLK
jgi:hypothetical protein